MNIIEMAAEAVKKRDDAVKAAADAEQQELEGWRKRSEARLTSFLKSLTLPDRFATTQDGQTGKITFDGEVVVQFHFGWGQESRYDGDGGFIEDKPRHAVESVWYCRPWKSKVFDREFDGKHSSGFNSSHTNSLTQLGEYLLIFTQGQ